MSRLRVGIVGAGVMGHHYAKALREYGRAEVAAICDLQPDVAAPLAADCASEAVSSG